MPIDISDKEQLNVPLTGTQMNDAIVQAHFSKDAIANIEGMSASASEIDDSAIKTQTVLPEGLINKGIDAVKFNSLDGVIFSPVEKSANYTVVNEEFFGGTDFIELNETVLGDTSKIIIPCDFSLMGCDHLNFYVWADSYENFGNIVLELGLNGGTNFFDKLSIVLKTQMTALPNHWNNIKIPISDMVLTGSATSESNILSIRLTTDGLSGKFSNVKFGGLKRNVKPRTAITFSFDDGMATDYTVVKPKLNELGFKFTTYIISDLIGTSFGGLRLTLPQLQEIVADGNYVGIHGTSLTENWVSQATLEQAEQHISDCLKYIIDNNLSNAGMYSAAYPMGEYNDDIIALLKKYNLKSARTTDARPQQMPLESTFKLKLGFVMKETLQENIDVLEALVAKGGLINIYQHEISTGSVNDPISPEVFNSFIDYINDNYRRYVTSIPEFIEQYETGTTI